jgi:hypothetical protein
MTARTPAERFYEAVESELDQERASVLGRYGRRVEEAIARCHDRLAQLDGDDPDTDADTDTVDAYRAERRAALHAVADLCLQREVLGLNDHTWVHRIYRVPPPR